MKKLLAVIMTAVLLVSALSLFTSCAGEKADYTVGICNYVDDASLNQIVDNIKAQLEKLAGDKNVTIKVLVENCNADANIMNQIITNFISKNVDVMVGVATPVAMAMQAATEDNQIPVVFAAVSDPVGVELVDSAEKPGHNITGTSDYLDTAAIMNLILAAKPEAKNVALLYDVGQDSSTAPVKAAKEFLTAHGISFKEYTGTNVNEVTLAVQSLIADGADAVFTPTDNTIMKAELAIYEMLADAKIPHFTGADSFALNGAFLGYGVDYANLGVETANMIGKILFDGAKPADMAVMTFDNGTATINTETCAAIGLDLETVKTAFTPFCTKINTLTTAESFDDLK